MGLVEERDGIRSRWIGANTESTRLFVESHAVEASAVCRTDHARLCGEPTMQCPTTLWTIRPQYYNPRTCLRLCRQFLALSAGLGLACILLAALQPLG